MQVGDRVQVLESVPYWVGRFGVLRSVGIATDACSVLIEDDDGKPRFFLERELRVIPNHEQARDELNDLALDCFYISRDHGFYEGVDVNDVEWQGMKIALMHSELSEALEATRVGLYNAPVGEHSVGEEFADAIIRILEQSEALGINIGAAVIEKMEKNRSRPYKHGKRC